MVIVEGNCSCSSNEKLNYDVIYVARDINVQSLRSSGFLKEISTNSLRIRKSKG